jgi:pimeloyl-ACP methyl ester carboxylesterase
MKHNFTLLFVLCLFCYNTKAQQLISYQYLQHYTAQDIDNILVNFGLPSGLIVAEYEVDYYKITYSTRNAQDTGNTLATGALVVPTGVSCPVPLISYQHGTTSLRYGVPSARGGSEYQIGIIAAALTGSVTSMPDYLGLGDSPGFHPYVHAASEASASIDLLRTARELSDSLSYNLNDQLFLFGYSQGGHSTMSLFRELETNLSNEFTVTACVPMSGPYDVSGVQAATITGDTSYATPGYLPYVIMGLQEAYGNVYTDLSEIFRAPYDTLLPGYFDGTHNMGWINNRLPDTPKHMLDTTYFQDFMANPNHIGWQILKDNDLYNWAPQAPLSMYYCTQDEQVFYKNALVARDSMHALGATHVIATDFGPFTHAGCASYCFLTGLALFQQYMDVSGGMLVYDSIQQPTSLSSNDGRIWVTPDSGISPYTYAWMDALAGQTAASVTGLGEGNYQVKVKDSRGCLLFKDINLTATTSIEPLESYQKFQLIPNPANDWLMLKILQPLQGRVQIRIIDQQGRIVRSVDQAMLALYHYNVRDLAAGTYFVQVENAGNIYSQKLLIQH